MDARAPGTVPQPPVACPVSLGSASLRDGHRRCVSIGIRERIPGVGRLLLDDVGAHRTEHAQQLTLLRLRHIGTRLAATTRGGSR